MINGSDFRIVWARHGNAAAEKISPNAKARIFVVQPAGRTIITQHDEKFRALQKLFFGPTKCEGMRLRSHALAPVRQQKGRREAGLFGSRVWRRSILGGDRATPAKPVVH